MFKRFPAFLFASAVLTVPACTQRNDASGSATVAAVSSTQLLSLINKPLSSAQADAIRGQKLVDVYTSTLDAATDSEFTVGEFTFSGVRTRLLAMQEVFAARAAKFGSIGEEMDALNINIKTPITPEDLKTILALGKKKAPVALALDSEGSTVQGRTIYQSVPVQDGVITDGPMRGKLAGQPSYGVLARDALGNPKQVTFTNRDLAALMACRTPMDQANLKAYFQLVKGVYGNYQLPQAAPLDSTYQ